MLILACEKNCGLARHQNEIMQSTYCSWVAIKRFYRLDGNVDFVGVRDTVREIVKILEDDINGDEQRTWTFTVKTDHVGWDGLWP